MLYVFKFLSTSHLRFSSQTKKVAKQEALLQNITKTLAQTLAQTCASNSIPQQGSSFHPSIP